MSLVEKLTLGFNTTIIGMGIVFIMLIFLMLIVMAESSIFKGILKGFEGKTKPGLPVEDKPAYVEKRGLTSGSMSVTGVEDDETLSVIMAAVSRKADIPLSRLKFVSIHAEKKILHKE